jgi:cation diffusion facilitator CzcD-associated flavoprotein CzcO
MSPRACIIGAGPAGIATARNLSEAGIDYDWLEKGSALGGLWRLDNDSGTSSAYRSLQIDTSSKSLALPDHPVPRSWPAYMGHAQVLEYLESYADKFDLTRRLTGSAGVRHITARPGGGWSVVADTIGTRDYDYVVVASGHLSKPRRPTFAGSFAGTQGHSHDYRVAEAYLGKRVLVVGMGNSAVDIAVDLARVARQVHISTRRSAWILPKYLMGIPSDRWSVFLRGTCRLPTPVARTLVGKAARLIAGKQENFGVPKPQHPIYREHATVSQELLPYVAYGWIQMHPDVARLEGDRVEFTDGSAVEADSIIYATGYDPDLDFLPAETVARMEEGGRLYRRIVHPESQGLYFIGLIQPVGSTIPLVHVQSRWLASVLTGGLELPSTQSMKVEIDSHRRAQQSRYLDSARYRLEVDGGDYRRQLEGDLEKRSVR